MMKPQMVVSHPNCCFLLLLILSVASIIGAIYPSNHDYQLQGGGIVAQSIMSAYPLPYCTVIFVTHKEEPSRNVLLEELQHGRPAWGMGTFEVMPYLDDNMNGTLSQFHSVIRNARTIRRWLSWNVVMVLASEDMQFLKNFAKMALDGRLLVWPSRLVIITRVSQNTAEDLLQNYWTYFMMNTVMLNAVDEGGSTIWHIYGAFPYTPTRQTIIRLGYWSPSKGLAISNPSGLFTEKYDNYHGSTINITALPFPPHWIVEETKNPDGTVTESYKGTDAALLQEIARVLNFTYRNVVVETWLECEERVGERVAFLSPVHYVILPNRMELHDYTFTYEFMSPAFCALKPTLKPQWESLYYPLAHEVWLSILCTLVFVPVVFYLGNSLGYAHQLQRLLSKGFIAEVFVGTLLSQPLSRRLPDNTSMRVLMCAWLIFSLIVGVAYRGNLTASLTLAKYPPRPETIAEINEAFDTVVMPSHGNEFKKFFEMPGSAQTFKDLASRMEVGPPAMECLQRAITGKVAYMDGRRFAAHHIAKYFTEADGSTPLYMAREDVLAGMSAWAIPHDAPFQPQIDFLMMAAIEGGLYEKWNEKILAEARLESQRKRKQELDQGGQKQEMSQQQKDGGNSGGVTAFTMVHMQGPFMLFVIGTSASALSFAGEVCVAKFS